MEITLIRHGKSLQTKNHKMTCLEFKNWVEEYDQTGVFEEDSFPIETLEKMEKANIVITSDLKRSIDSARLLDKRRELVSDPLFRETGLPTSFSKINRLKLYPSVWAIMLRCMWFMGYSSGCESLANARIRAGKASKILVEYAREHEKVVLVGHGFFNMLLVKELRKQGFIGKRRTNSKHWHATTFLFRHKKIAALIGM